MTWPAVYCARIPVRVGKYSLCRPLLKTTAHSARQVKRCGLSDSLSARSNKFDKQLDPRRGRVCISSALQPLKELCSAVNGSARTVTLLQHSRKLCARGIPLSKREQKMITPPAALGASL